MDSLRRRIPFKLAEDDNDNDSDIYDEQQQEFVIQELRQEANIFNRRALFSLRILVGLSCVIQLGFNNLQPNNRAILSSRKSMLSILLRIILNASSCLIHYHLAVILSKQFRDYFYPYSDSTPVSYRFIYSVSLLAPAISLYFEIPWEIAIWWSYTPLLVFVIHRVMNSIEDVDRGIVNLEALKYKAPGA